MHTHQHNFWREKRFAYQMEGAAEVLMNPEVANVTEQTHGLLEGLKNTIALPSQTVGLALDNVVLTGLSALNIALLGGVIASGLYMVVAGKAPPILQKLTGKDS